ncbi:hypothetical protein COHA_002087 [Chlorella ohadii]|uniref:Uncharacterized protein n=1 Tax=Chlorella ohadii TaxID=2649997 RepID=A0AAD5E130_9CHLO|nr:hypothetical protein COHA_002087 [Chlorella ohadii]
MRQSKHAHSISRTARLAARAQEQQQQQAAPAAEDEPLAAEQLLKRGPRKAGGGGKKQQGPKVIAPVRDQVYGGGPQTPVQKAENTVVATLAVLFFVILIEGILVAGSGFMSEEMDAWVAGTVLPAFTPTMGLFLAISTGYGLWKTRAAPEEKSN